MVWKTRFVRGRRISLISSARMMGNGKPTMMRMNEMMIVLRNAGTNPGSVSMYLKCSKSFHFIAEKAVFRRYFLNASWMPYIGM